MQGQDIETWIYRNIDEREAIISFRGTMTPEHMLTDIDLDLAAFNPGGRKECRSPEEVSDEIPDEEIMKGPLEPLMNMCKVGCSQTRSQTHEKPIAYPNSFPNTPDMSCHTYPFFDCTRHPQDVS